MILCKNFNHNHHKNLQRNLKHVKLGKFSNFNVNEHTEKALKLKNIS